MRNFFALALLVTIPFVYLAAGKFYTMITYRKTNSENTDFQQLVVELDAELAIRDGDMHDFYHQFNKTTGLKYVIVAYDQETPVGCGSIKEYSADVMEVKRMYVPLMRRGQGIASGVLKELQQWAGALGYKKCMLETGKNQPEAQALYKKNGFKIIPNYGQYENAANSICFEKILIV
jgi:putative acetyltransferase